MIPSATLKVNAARLTREQEDDIVIALAAGASQREAAARVNVSQKAVWSRMQKSEFMAQVEAARDAFAESRPELLFLYGALARCRAALLTVERVNSGDLLITADEARKHLRNAVRWLEEWAWLLEQN